MGECITLPQPAESPSGDFLVRPSAKMHQLSPSCPRKRVVISTSETLTEFGLRFEEPELPGPKIFRSPAEALGLERMSPRRTHSCHDFDSAVHEFVKTELMVLALTVLVDGTNKCIDQPRQGHKDDGCPYNILKMRSRKMVPR